MFNLHIVISYPITKSKTVVEDFEKGARTCEKSRFAFIRTTTTDVFSYRGLVTRAGLCLRRTRVVPFVSTCYRHSFFSFSIEVQHFPVSSVTSDFWTGRIFAQKSKLQSRGGIVGLPIDLSKRTLQLFKLCSSTTSVDNTKRTNNTRNTYILFVRDDDVNTTAFFPIDYVAGSRILYTYVYTTSIVRVRPR